MTLIRSKPSGYGIHDSFTSVEAEIVDSQLPFALDGNGGGSYAPSADITFTGTSGLTFTGASHIVFSASSILAIHGTSVLEVGATGQLVAVAGAVMIWNGTTTFGGNVFIGATGFLEVQSGGDISIVSGGSFAAAAGATFVVSTTASMSAATFTGAVTFSSATAPLTVSGAGTVNFNNAITQIGGALNISAVVTLISSAHICKRVVSAGLDANTTIGVTSAAAATGDIFKPGSISANRTWVVVDATEGAEIEVSLIDCSTGFIVALNRSDATTIVSLSTSGGVLLNGCKLAWHSGQWQVEFVLRK